MTYIAHRAYRADIPIKLATTMVCTGYTWLYWYVMRMRMCGMLQRWYQLYSPILRPFLRTTKTYEWLDSRWFKSFIARWLHTGALRCSRSSSQTIWKHHFKIFLTGPAPPLQWVDCEDLSHNGIELKQTTLHCYSQVNTSNETLDRWSQPRFFDQMANRSSWRPLWVPEISPCRPGTWHEERRWSWLSEELDITEENWIKPLNPLTSSNHAWWQCSFMILYAACSSRSVACNYPLQLSFVTRVWRDWLQTKKEHDSFF